MIKIEKIDIWGFEHAIRGMRNPMNSWSKSDTTDWDGVGPHDLELMRKLYKAGTEHRKYARQIFVSMDVTAPLYWWKEFDQYKIGTVTDSCSTMHKITENEFYADDFSHEHIMGLSLAENEIVCSGYDFNASFEDIIYDLNVAREMYLRAKAKPFKDESKRAEVMKDCWWQIIQLLPSSYNQLRTVTMNYENVFSIINQRTGHKLDEWNDFVDTLKSLPYVAEITED